MSFPAVFLLVLAGLLIGARARMHAVLLGQPVVIPWLAIAAAVVILALSVLVLLLVRTIICESRAVPGAAT